MSTAGTNPLTDERVTFIQHQLPGLEDGEYELTVAQYVLDNNGKKISDDSLTNTYTFAVLGDRFALSTPATTLLSVFPPQGATGEFSAVLPHVVLGEPTFPWTRFPTTDIPYTPPAPGKDVDSDVPTWLAVLVLDENDVGANPGLLLTPVAGTVGDLFPPAVVSGSTLGNNYSYFWQETTVAGLEPNQAVTDQIQYLDLPLTLFWQIAPTVADLQLTAHTRTVTLVNKPTGQGKPLGQSLGTASIVVGTRLPQGPQAGTGNSPAQGGFKTYAYLVSLEELQPFLPTAETGGAPAKSSFKPGTSLRLAVLANWTFFTTGDTAGFVDSLLTLNGRSQGSNADAVNTDLRMNYAGSNPTVAAALNMGFVPLNETLRDAGKTVSWYRGPCAPYQNTEPAPTLPLSSSDQALLFDPTTGMFDTSYAAAWSLGRQLALQDTAFATALYRWKADLTAAIVNAVEAEFLAEAFGTLFAAPTPTTGGQTSGPPMGASRSLRRQTMLALAKGSQPKAPPPANPEP